MEAAPSPAVIRTLFANGDPDEVWAKAVDIIWRIDPAFDFSSAQVAFHDVVRLFRGEYPGYRPMSTLYHDLNHTLDVFLCAVRLLHGVHVSGTCLDRDSVTHVMIATMMHDTGYAQLHGDEEGTGAKYLKTHVRRSVEFMRSHIEYRHLPVAWAEPLEAMILCTDPALQLSQIPFPDERVRLLGQIVGTADLVGQMADRIYLEKLLFLYFEFKEANFGGYRNMPELLSRTKDFHAATLKKLGSELGGVYARLSLHFKEMLGVECNYYLESIEKNIAYLSQIDQLDEKAYLSMLKRGGIVEKSIILANPNDLATPSA